MNKPLIACNVNITTLRELKEAVDRMVVMARMNKVGADEVFLEDRTSLRLVVNTLMDKSETLDLQIVQEDRVLPLGELLKGDL
jgi:transcriptional regulator with AAA-type ATPase domain